MRTLNKPLRYGLACLLFSSMLLSSSVNASIYLVRHAERISQKDDASLLSRQGKKRAKVLQHVLSSVKLTAIYCTEYKRTQQTAAPVAEAQHLPPTITNSEDIKGLAEKLKAVPIDEDVLVVGHTDTIPDLLKELGAPPIPIAKTDYDNLFIVTPRKEQSPQFQRLHYGEDSGPSSQPAKP
ncbi:MAG: histidine phosphatase family protein [Elusimicrobia bacterium]|nr:histidine phosphatase family protein [Elusimicrobiota bacterium]